MNYWILKSEPDVFGFDQLIKEKIATWDGVRNYQARNNLKLMQVGDIALFYHSNIGLEIVGEAKIVESFFQDPTTDDDKWVAVKVAPIRKFKKTLQLSQIKADDVLKNIALVRNGRLSVMPLTKTEYSHILALIS